MLREQVREIFTKEDFEKHFGGLAEEKDIELLTEAITAMLEHRLDELCDIGKRLFKNDVLITHFFYIFEKVISILEEKDIRLRLSDMMTAKKMLSKGYIHEELAFDKKILQRYMSRRIVAESKELSRALNIHVRWMISFINSILNDSLHEAETLTEWLNLTDHLEVGNINDGSYKHVINSLKKTAQRLAEAYKSGSYFYFSVLYRELMGYSSKMQNLLILNHMSEEIISIYTDYLTGLNNQLKLKQDLNLYKDKYLFLVDIQDFRKINVTYGFDAGDKLIKEVARKLKSFKEYPSYRFIGNEFALIVNSKEEPLSIIKELELEVYTINNHNLSLFFYGSYGKVAPRVLEYAEFGLMEAKRLKDHIVDADTYKDKETEIINHSRDLFSVNAQIKLAMASDRIVPYLQGIFRADRLDKPDRYEALVRIENTDGSVMTPAKFLPTLKKTYIYPEATKILFLKCIEIIEQTGIEISFNLSMLDIANQHTTKFLKTVLLEKPEIASKVIFEITEEEAIEQFKEVKEFVDEVKKLGVRIAIDDFGSGYSNYSYIFGMNPDYIKIDGSLTSEIVTNPNQVAFVKSLVEMCKNIGIQTTAEFVDSKEKLEKLKELGVDYMQGFYLHKPENYLKIIEKLNRPAKRA